MRFVSRVVLMGAACGALASHVWAQDVKLTEQKKGLTAKAKVDYATALTTAQARVPAGKLHSAEIEQEKGKLIYSLVFRTPGKAGQEEVNVSAITGKIVSVEHEKVPAAAVKKDPKTPSAGRGPQ